MSKNRGCIKRAVVMSHVAALLIAAAPTYAGEVYTWTAGNGDRVSLFDDACPNASGWMPMHRAEFFYRGKSYKACWALLRNIVLIFDEDGDITPIPVDKFSKDTSV